MTGTLDKQTSALASTLLARATQVPRRTRILGILNVTPDSFSDGGQFFTPDAAIARGLALLEAGADALDIGAESSRPGADPVAAAEELRRLLPVITALRLRTNAPLSVDTCKASVARAALAAGASASNDITALSGDPEMAEVAAAAQAEVILMHMQGTPRTMQQHPQYQDVVAEVRNYLLARARAAERAGIAPQKIILDPGIGFGKLLQHNLTLLAAPGWDTLGYPVVIGVSRKAFIGALLHQPDAAQRQTGSLAVAAIAVANGCALVRTHDVRAAVEFFTLYDALRRPGGET